MNKNILIIFPGAYSDNQDEVNLDFLTRYIQPKPQNDNLYVFSTDKMLKPYVNINLKKMFKMNNWEDIKTELDSLHETYKFDKVIFYRLRMSGSSNFDSMNEKNSWVKKIQNNDFSGFTFVTMFNVFIRNLLCTHFYEVHGVPTEHYVIDPQEADFSKVGLDIPRYFFYDVPEKNLRFSTFPLEIITSKYQTKEKELEFTFGYTVLTEDRKKIFEEIQPELEAIPNAKIFCKNKYKKINTLVKKKEYDDYISRSDFTLIIPSYDEEEFSLLRFLEAIQMKCIPLLYKCNIERAQKNYPKLFDLCEKHGLIIDSLDLRPKMYSYSTEQRRKIQDELYDELQNRKLYK